MCERVRFLVQLNLSLLQLVQSYTQILGSSTEFSQYQRVLCCVVLFTNAFQMNLPVFERGQAFGGWH